VKAAGQLVLTPFPTTDLSAAKLRPVLLLCKASTRFDDWLVCMVSSQIHQAEPELDEFIRNSDEDFSATGLKVSSIVRVSRLAVLQGESMIGRLGQVSPLRLMTLRTRVARWSESGGGSIGTTEETGARATQDRLK
jgi:mRNA interferase MazF